MLSSDIPRPSDVERWIGIVRSVFSELRYPQELKNFAGLGPMEIIVLEAIVDAILPFAPKTH